jgi:predicted ATPase/DNA-binding SARP family transcriptional activator
MKKASDGEATAAPCLGARLFGGSSLAVGDRVPTDRGWSRRDARDLLLLLLITPAHRLSRERVFEALWPESPPDVARNAYYKALHTLRHVLEPDLAARAPGSFIAATADAIALVPGTFTLDVDTFEVLLERANASDGEQRIDLLRQALTVYSGDLLEDEPVADWVVEPRERLRRLWQRAVFRLGALELTRDEPLTVFPLLEAIVGVDPTSEEAHRLLIRAYDRAGKRDLARRQYERCVAALRDELAVDPSDETRRVAASLLDPELPRSLAERHDRPRWSSVPVPLTRLIGREAEMDRLRDLLHAADVRMLTLVGPGGVGKTRLAIEVAQELGEELHDSVGFVSLAPVRDPALVLSTIARALNVREEQGRSPFDQICATLRDRSALLILDNFEHVRGAAPALTEVLATCPGVTMLVTSREPLHLRPERLVEVPPLEVPSHDGDDANLPPLAVLARAPAVSLFVERAEAVLPGFVLSQENGAIVARICARLDGLPLAIELAAARSRELPPPRLLDHLADRLATLVDGYGDLPTRQRTMRAAIAWSHDLLDADLQRLFRRLSVFAGGSTVEIAAHVAAMTPEEASARVQALVEKHLLSWRTGSDRPRADMLETTREFGLDCLEQASETAMARDVLVTYVMGLTTAAAEQLAGPDQGRWLDRLDEEHDNLREALAWTIAHSETDRAIALAGNLWRYWWCRTNVTEGREWLDRALALASPSNPSLRGAALNGAASLAENQGDFARASALHAEALRLWRELGSLAGEARALSGLGTAAAYHGDYATARDYHERSLALSRYAGDHLGMGRTLDRLGTVAKHQGDFARAGACYAESLELFRQSGDLVNASIVLSNLGEVCHQQGQAERAAALFEEALRLQRELDLPDGVAYDLVTLARVRLDLGEVERAAALSAQGIRLFRDMGNQIGLAGALAVFGNVARARGDPARAVDFLHESLHILQNLDVRAAMPEQIEALAAAVLDTGDAQRAVRLLGVAAALREQITSPLSPVGCAVVERTLSSARALLGDQAVALALAAGRALPLDRALTQAVAE